MIYSKFPFQYFIIFLFICSVTSFKEERTKNGTILTSNVKYSATQTFTVVGEPNISRKCRCSEVDYCREKSFTSRKQCVSSCSHFLQYFADNVEKTVDICFNEHQDDYKSEKKYDCTLFNFCTKDNGKDTRDVYIPKYNLTYYHMHYRKIPTANIFSETPQNKKNLLTFSYFKKFQHCLHSCVKYIANTCYNNDKKCSVELNEFNKQTARQIEYCTCMSVNVHIYMKKGCTCMHEKMKIEKLGGICELIGNHIFKKHYN
uniref:DB domain-containing protein n=1 Tax=Strongyloides papillosus TaxID=174720 RepID=A0A0N5BYA5_STREA